MREEETSNATFAESILGKSFFDDPLMAGAMRLSPSWRLGALAALFSGLLFIPFLGAVGMWDPWEVHYGEVARAMVHRGDYVYEYWENGWLFSKPAMTMWLMALGMNLVGTNALPEGQGGDPGMAVLLTILTLGMGASAWMMWQRKNRLLMTGLVLGAMGAFIALVLAVLRIRAAGAGPEMQPPGALSVYTEWGMRLPFAIVSIMAVTLLTLAMGRVVSRRAAMATCFVLCTMPLYFLLTRQAVTDTPFVSFFVSAMACAMIGQLDVNTQHRAGWWYASYIFMGAATLAKGPIGLGFPAVTLLLYAMISVIPWSFASAKKHWDWLAKYAGVPALIGLGAMLLVTFISYVMMRDAFSGREPFEDGLLVRKIFAGIIGFNAGVLAFVLTLHRAVPAEGELPSLWAQLYKMRLGTGVVLFFAVALPWYLTMILFEENGNAEENQLFWYRFFIHDNVNRLLAGVHTTTPGGTFTYFIEQGGFAIFPWVALVPGALALVSRLKVRSLDPADHVGVIATLWMVITFTLLGSSSTKFHHYVFPILPALAILIGLYIDKLWQEGVARHALLLILGLGLMVLVAKDLASNPKNFTDLFVYNYDRPYPQDMINKPLALFSLRNLWIGDLACVISLALGGYLVFDGFHGEKGSRVSRMFGYYFLGNGVTLLAVVWTRGSMHSLLAGAFGLAVMAAGCAYEGVRRKKFDSTLLVVAGALFSIGVVAALRGYQLAGAADPLVKSVVKSINTKDALGLTFTLAAVLLIVAAALRAKTMLFGTFWAFAFGFALWFNWNHWVDLSHHWTQRDLFWKYYRDRKPDEPITAFLMNWRGETFYSRNTVKQIKENPKMSAYAELPGRKWALVEHNRLGILKTAAGSHVVTVQSTAETNNKFVLVTIE